MCKKSKSPPAILAKMQGQKGVEQNMNGFFTPEGEQKVNFHFGLLKIVKI